MAHRVVGYSTDSDRDLAHSSSASATLLMANEAQILSRDVGGAEVPAMAFSDPNVSYELENHYSSAQICNWDVLSLIFSMLGPPDLYSATLTCRTWSLVAHGELYKTIRFVWRAPSEPVDKTILLARTLTECAGARAQIRHLAICLYLPENSSRPPFDWITLLPDSISSFALEATGPIRHHVGEPIFRADFLTSLNSFHQFGTPTCFEDRDRLAELLRRMPVLRTCIISLGEVEVPCPPPTFISPRLECLCVQLTKVGSWLPELLRLAAPTLRILQFAFFWMLLPTDVVEKEKEKAYFFEHALIPMPRLEQLQIRFIGPVEFNTAADFRLSERFPMLGKVYTDSKVDLPALLRTLPPTVSTLGIGSTHPRRFPSHELASLLESSPKTHPALKILHLFARESVVPDAGKYPHVKQHVHPSCRSPLILHRDLRMED